MLTSTLTEMAFALLARIQAAGNAGAAAPAQDGTPSADPVASGDGIDLSDPAGALNKLKDLAIDYAPKLGAALAIFVLGWLVAKMVRGAIGKTMRRAKVDQTLIGFITNMIYMALMVFVVISALGKLGVPTNSFVAIIGAAGLAVGFALQGSLSNFAAGVMIILFRPFKIGDYIEGSGKQGKVVDIQIFQTILNTPDNRRIIVPNGQLTSDTIINYNVNPERRLDMVFGIGYDDDIKLAKEILERLVSEDARCLETPAPTIGVAELADSSVNLMCRPWVKPKDYWDVKSELTEKAKLAFDAAGISIPFPQRDVHVHKSDVA